MIIPKSAVLKWLQLFTGSFPGPRFGSNLRLKKSGELETNHRDFRNEAKTSGFSVLGDGALSCLKEKKDSQHCVFTVFYAYGPITYGILWSCMQVHWKCQTARTKRRRHARARFSPVSGCSQNQRRSPRGDGSANIHAPLYAIRQGSPRM